MRKLAFLFSLTLALIFVLSLAPGCARQPPSPGTTSTPASGQPKTGGTLRYWSIVAPGGFDLHQKPAYGPVFAGPVFNNLVNFDPTKNDISLGSIRGDLAERWELSNGDRTITFFLRKGVKWHDGTPLGADDVVYSIEKMMDPKRSVMSTSFPTFDRVDKVDDSTVRVTLKTPSPSFMVQMAGPWAAIEAKHKASADFRTPEFAVGTGPFRLKEYQSGVGADYVKNPDYFRKGFPYVDALRINLVSDRSAALDALATGRLDMSSPNSGPANDAEEERLNSQVKGLVLSWFNSTSPGMYWLNVDYGPLKDVRVRRAVSLVADREQIVAGSRGSAKWGDLTRGLFSAAYGLPAEEVARIRGTDKNFDARVAEAKKLMAEAGYASGFKFKILTWNTTEWTKNVTILGDFLRRHLNLDVEILAREATEMRKIRDTKDFHLYADNSSSSTGDPDEVMVYFLTNSPSNYNGYSNPAGDKLWDQQSQTMDYAKRRDLTQQIERMVLTDCATLPLSYGRYELAWWPYVKGFALHNAIYSNKNAMETVWLDK